ncbi:MAG: dipeptidase PepE [Bacteroidales bacterium]|nr:dipeptidase PepE [Bacteroidales bacterium]
MKLLLISNSTMAGEPYLEYTIPHIQLFLEKKHYQAIFIPYAGVTISWDHYSSIVSDRFSKLNCFVHPIHKEAEPKKAIKECDLIIIGGGNTFQLLKILQDNDLIEIIQQKVKEGTPYIGWSAGANMACPTLCTTNDMPIIEPSSFNALHLIPFQINPHYTDIHPEGHAGETRDDRIAEFIEVTPDRYVVGLREGSILKVVNNRIDLLCGKSVKIFKKGITPFEIDNQDDLQFLLTS